MNTSIAEQVNTHSTNSVSAQSNHVHTAPRAHPRALLASIWRHKSLILAMTKREVLGRYRGSIMGLAWSFFYPVIMLAVYTFVFSVVFKARWNGGSDSKTEFALVLFAGLTVYSIFSEAITRAPGIIIAHTNYVKKVVFPLEILTIISLGSALFHAGVSLLVWLVFYTLLFGLPHATVLLFPLIVLPLVLFVLGVSWFFASVGTYIRDLGQMVGVATTMLMFLTPIFYPISALPEGFQTLMLLNPLSLVIEHARGVLMWGQAPHWGALALQTVGGALVAWAGFAWFQKTRQGFADVL